MATVENGRQLRIRQVVERQEMGFMPLIMNFHEAVEWLETKASAATLKMLNNLYFGSRAVFGPRLHANSAARREFSKFLLGNGKRKRTDEENESEDETWWQDIVSIKKPSQRNGFALYVSVLKTISEYTKTSVSECIVETEMLNQCLQSSCRQVLLCRFTQHRTIREIHVVVKPLIKKHKLFAVTTVVEDVFLSGSAKAWISKNQRFLWSCELQCFRLRFHPLFLSESGNLVRRNASFATLMLDVFPAWETEQIQRISHAVVCEHLHGIGGLAKLVSEYLSS